MYICVLLVSEVDTCIGYTRIYSIIVYIRGVK